MTVQRTPVNKAMYPETPTNNRFGMFAAACFLCALLGSIAGLVYGWDYNFDRGWFVVWSIASAYFVWRAVWEPMRRTGGGSATKARSTLEVKKPASTEHEVNGGTQP